MMPRLPVRNMIKHNNTFTKSSGVALVESVVTVGVVVVLITGLLSLTSKSLNASQFGKNKSTAVGYASSAIEIVRKERDSSWAVFSAKASAAPGTMYCLSGTSAWTNPVSGACPTNVNSFYSRSVTYTNVSSGTPKVIIDVVVRWSEGSIHHDTKLKTYFTQWR